MNALAPRRNRHLKEDIREYWSGRAATFDDAPGHFIPDAAVAAWRQLIEDALGPPAGRRVLDLACGTGEISRVLLGMGAEVTGLDFSESMLDRARAKHAGKRFRGILADAEAPGEPPGRYDGAIARHLVWTLTDPAAALAAWRAVLRPGARVLVIDGDFVGFGPVGRAQRWLADRLDGGRPTDPVHAGILAQLPYRDGLSASALERLLLDAGFTAPRQHQIGGLMRAMLRGQRLATRLRVSAYRRFALSAARPAGD